VRIYARAKTVADCFKFRNKWMAGRGPLEALRDAWRGRGARWTELWTPPASAGMTNVMRPYLESLA